MTVTRYANNFYQGLAADTKPTNVPAGAIYRATDTGDIYHYNGSSWDLIVGASKTETLTNKTINADNNTVSNIENADIKAAAGIVYSKLTLTNSIVNADINSAAAIDTSKLADSANFLTTTNTKTVTNKTIAEASNTITRREAYTYLIYPHGAIDFRVKRGSDGAIVYTSSNVSADALGALEYCRDAIGNTSPGGLIQLTEGYFPLSATFSLSGDTHRYQTYQGVGNGSVFGPLTQIRATGDFPAVTIDGSTTNALGHSFRNIYFTHNTAAYSSGLIRLLDHVVECTFDNLAFYDFDNFAGDCFKMEITNTTDFKAQYEQRIQNCTSRGFDNFIHANNQANIANDGSFISSMNIDHCNVMNAKRVLKVVGVSGAQILDWHFDRIMFQYSASNAATANTGVFDYDSSVSCWNQKHSNCMIWDITTPGINYANVGSSVELALNECNPAFRIGGSGAYLNKVKATDYYTGGTVNVFNSGWVSPASLANQGEGLLQASTIVTPGGGASLGQDTISPYITCFSGATSGANTGFRRGAASYRMEHQPYFEAYAGPSNTSITRVAIGLTTNLIPADSDTILATTESGILAGWRPSDTNIQIFHHDGDGSAMTVIDTGIAKVTSMWKCAFLISSTSFTWMVATANGSKVGTPVTTQIPATGVSMGMLCNAQPNTTTNINMNTRYVKLVLRGL